MAVWAAGAIWEIGLSNGTKFRLLEFGAVAGRAAPNGDPAPRRCTADTASVPDNFPARPFVRRSRFGDFDRATCRAPALCNTRV